MSVGAASHFLFQASATTTAAEYALPGGTSRVTIDVIDSTNGLHFNFGSSDDSVATTNGLIQPKEHRTFTFEKGEHSHLHYRSNTGSCSFVVSVDTLGNQ